MIEEWVSILPVESTRCNVCVWVSVCAILLHIPWGISKSKRLPGDDEDGVDNNNDNNNDNIDSIDGPTKIAKNKKNTVRTKTKTNTKTTTTPTITTKIHKIYL